MLLAAYFVVAYDYLSTYYCYILFSVYHGFYFRHLRKYILKILYTYCICLGYLLMYTYDIHLIIYISCIYLIVNA